MRGRRQLAVGVLVGVVLSGAAFAGLRAAQDLFGGWDVTREDVQLAAMNEYLGERAIPAGSHVEATIDYRGENCGGVVELRVLDGDTEIDRALYLVVQDSGDPLPSRANADSLREAGKEFDEVSNCD